MKFTPQNEARLAGLIIGAVMALFVLQLAFAEEPKADWRIAPSAGAILFTVPATASNLTFGIGSGLVIHCDTGEVTLPKDKTLDATAIEFWKKISESFPEARRQIIGREKIEADARILEIADRLCVVCEKFTKLEGESNVGRAAIAQLVRDRAAIEAAKKP